MTTQPHITCIGIATVDVITEVSKDFLKAHDIPFGATALVDAHKLGYLLESMQHPQLTCGGSSANVACGLGLQGLRTDFLGSIGSDTYGTVFRNGFKPYHVEFRAIVTHDHPTSTCLCFVTPDKERSFAASMSTAGYVLSPHDLPALPDSDNEFICIETNTTAMPQGCSLEESVFSGVLIKYGHTNIRIFVGLNDREVMETSRSLMRDALTCPNVTIMGNLGELLVLFDVHDMAIAFQKAQESGRDFIITNGADGVYIITRHNIEHIPVEPISANEIVDTIGAGDQFAAGFIGAIAQNKSMREAVQAGIEAATRILKEVGGRPAVE
jgi:sugar/nucleoside kinase (ribokinase family)